MQKRHEAKLPKVLSLPDVVLFTVSAIVLLEVLSASASIGPSAIFWWLFFGATFLAPLALITAEVGTAIPAEGGIYVWVRRVFGSRWASRVIWSYWVNTAIWLPSVFILLCGFVSTLFDLKISIGAEITVGLILSWLTVLVDVVGLNVGKWVPNLGALLKMLIFGVLIIGGLNLGFKHGFVNPFTVHSVSPNWSEGLKYLPFLINGLLGFELVSCAGEEIRNPRRNVPLGIFYSALCVMIMYVLATVGILAVIPYHKVDIINGLIDTLNLFFAHVPGGHLIALALGCGVAFTFFSNGATWTMGCNRTAAQAAKDGELPRIFGWTHPVHGGPVGSAIIMGIVASVTLLLYGTFEKTSADLFWSLTAFSSVIFMLPYMGLALAFLKLRESEPDLQRPYVIPGGKTVAYILGYLSIFVLLLTIFLFCYIPDTGPQWSIIIGSIVSLVLGEVVIRLSEPSKRTLKSPTLESSGA